MDLFELFFSFIFVLVLLKVYGWSMRVEPGVLLGRWVRRDESFAGGSTEPPTVWGATPLPAIERDPHRTEAILVARRLAGDLGPAGYRQAMAELAAQDATCHPVVIPRDTGA